MSTSDLTGSLDTFGYSHTRNLAQNASGRKQHSPDPLCVYYDILVDDRLVESSAPAYQQLFQIITSSHTSRPRRTSFHPSPAQKRRFVKNDERRNNLITEFIVTEDNYVASLKSFVSTIVRPISLRARAKQGSVLGPYECSKIFMNIEQLLQVNDAFRLDLEKYRRQNSAESSFGEICLTHLRRFVDCYHKFLLGVESAQTFNTKEQKNNSVYQAFLDKVKQSATVSVYDYLALPGQRVGRYTMFLKEIIKHTRDDHPDLANLNEALLTAEEIANMSEDYHTKLIRIFHNMLQAIQNCPASLISQQRTLICHLDALEVDPLTFKTLQPVTFFLFSDKLMVVRRPSPNVDGLELCGLDNEKDKTGLISLLARKSEHVKRYDRKLKFRGWINLVDIEIHEGAAALPTSFSLSVSALEQQTAIVPNVDPQTRDALEGYFLEGRPRLFTLTPSQMETNSGSKSLQTLLQEKQGFVEAFGRTKSCNMQSDELLQLTHCQWGDYYFFANIYRLSSYHLVSNKCPLAVVFHQDNAPDLREALSSNYMTPHMLGFLLPSADSSNSSKKRFFIRSKLALGCVEEGDVRACLELSPDVVDEFRNHFFKNLMACDRDLREVGRVASSLSSFGRRQGSSFMKPSARQTLRQELSRRRSLSTFKLFAGISGSQTSVQSVQRPKSYSHDENASIDMESRISHSYSLSSSSKDSRYTYYSDDRRSSIVDSESSSNRKRFSYGNDNDSRISLQPSIHPSNSASYELKPNINRDPSVRTSYLEERVKALYGNLDQKSDMQLDQKGMPKALPLRSTSVVSFLSSSDDSRSVTQGAYSSGYSTPRSSSRNTFSTPSITGQDTPLSQHSVNKEIGDSLLDPTAAESISQIKEQSPFSTESSLATPPPSTSIADEGIEKLANEMDHMRDEFNTKYNTMIRGYEEMSLVVRNLTKELKKKDEEMAVLRVKYQDTIAENDLLYEAFNSELDQLSAMLEEQQGVPPADSGSEERPSNPSPEMQMWKKLESTIRERNQWHQTACKLARELQDLSAGLGIILDGRHPTTSTSTPPLITRERRNSRVL